jgi:aspartyl/asparaginyl-tRNA synthetase
MDLRAPANNAIMRIQSAICQLFRESLYSKGFIEIHTPKLIEGESESGAEVFRTDYFGKEVSLAQSPQLYKQMAISSDLQRVFEVGPVFRAENSNTRRHLCEFTGLDLEMAIDDHYDEALEVIHGMFKHIFTGLESRFPKELAVIRQQYHSEPVTFTDEPCILHWTEGMDILKEQGFDMGDCMGDLTGAQELALGAAVKEKYGTDFFMLDRYPSIIRPFYTMPCPDDGRFSNSYDIFIRGQEICSGAQRCHDPEMLLGILEDKGMEMSKGLNLYVESFRHGVSPHAGAGIGLERVVFLYLGLDNVRKASMFPRDPNRCSP